MDLVRTPEAASTSSPGSPIAPRYADLPDGLRMHYVDEGPAAAETVLLLHGQPTWSYLYRTVVARLVERGLRAVAPDLDRVRPLRQARERTAHSVRGHVDWMAQFTEARRARASDARRAGLGRPDRPRRPRRATRAGPPRRRRQHGAAHRGRRTGRPPGLGLSTPTADGTVTVDQELLDYQRLTQELTPFRPSLFVQGATTSDAARGRPGRLRRAVPRRVLLRRPAPAAPADGAHTRAARAPG